MHIFRPANFHSILTLPSQLWPNMSGTNKQKKKRTNKHYKYCARCWRWGVWQWWWSWCSWARAAREGGGGGREGDMWYMSAAWGVNLLQQFLLLISFSKCERAAPSLLFHFMKFLLKHAWSEAKAELVSDARSKKTEEDTIDQTLTRVTKHLGEQSTTAIKKKTNLVHEIII